MTSHKSEEKLMRLPLLFGLMIAIVVAGIVVIVSWRLSHPDPSPNVPYPEAKTVYRDAITPEPPRPSLDQETHKLTLVEQARALKPISKLEQGDRVLYDGNEERPVCEFVSWAPSAIARGSIVNAMIQCPNEGPFEIQTGYLTSIEAVVPG
jgi:hypothetical protein